MLLLALDDTDTREGGCTTETAFRIAVALTEASGPLATWGLVDAPRLVRLCPAIRERTRGNGALVLPIGPLDADAVPGWVGTRNGPDGLRRVLTAQTASAPAAARLDDAVVSALKTLVHDVLPPPGADQADPQPAAVLLPEPPQEALYERALTGRISPDAATGVAPPGTHWLTPKRRGIVGALAAAAWRPDPARMTWEAIAYRRPAAARPEGPAFTTALAEVPGGFDNVAATTGRVRAVPRTPCPVAFAARGVDPEALARLLHRWTPRDGPGGWLLRTNQARDAHAHHARSRPSPESVVRIDVRLTGRPSVHTGGHVFAPARTTTGRTVTLAAYEPTKTLPRILRDLVPDDMLRILGRVDQRGDVIALERLELLEAAPVAMPAANPRCADCAVAMKSRGRQAPFRCPRCHRSAPRAARAEIPVARSLQPGLVVQVADEARGHLLGPLGGLPAAHWDLPDARLLTAAVAPA